MKKILKFSGLILAIFLLISLVLLTHAGLFQSVIVVEKMVGPYTMVYQSHQGPYYQVKSAMDEIYYGLERMGIQTYRGIGLYYDNPSQVEASQLRSEVGSILEEKDLNSIDQIEEKFLVKTLAKQGALVAEFPIRNPLSYVIGPQKVYSKIDAVRMELGYVDPEFTIEIYDEANQKIIYLVPTTVDEEESSNLMDSELEFQLEEEIEVSPETSPVDEATQELEVVDQSQADLEMELKTAVKEAIIEKRGGDADDLEISINTIEGEYAQGGARNISSPVGGGMWFAAKVDDNWQLVWDGNGAIYCDDLTDYPDFPTSLIPECYDENTGQVLER